MGDDTRFPHVRVPMFLFDRTKFPKVTASALLTYLGARSFAYVGSKCNGRFARCWPSKRAIGERVGQSARTVARNLALLEKAGLLYRKPRKGSWVITFVDAPGAFQEAVNARGRGAARLENESRLDAIVETARTEMAETTRERRRGGSETVRLATGGTRRTSGRVFHSTTFRGDDLPPVAPPPVANGTSDLPPVAPEERSTEELETELHGSGTHPAPEVRGTPASLIPSGESEDVEERQELIRQFVAGAREKAMPR